jgi:hypothetical protein
VKILAKKIIYGCDSRGDGNSPYLTRWTLIETRFGAVYLHKFHRSDSPEHHDHPWRFASFILWRGYVEETACPACGGTGVVRIGESGLVSLNDCRCGAPYVDSHKRKRVWPGMLLFRKATHRHRVVLVDGKPAWTLVVRGPYERIWGFFTPKGWQDFRDYFRERGC